MPMEDASKRIWFWAQRAIEDSSSGLNTKYIQKDRD